MLTDEAAHAWTEIFLPGYGWTPVEVTPSASGDMTASYPGFDGSALRRLIAENSTEAELPDILQTEDDGPSQRTEEDRTDDAPAETADRETENASEASAGRYLICAACIAAVAGIVCLIAFCRRRVLLGRLEQADCREIFFRFTGMLKYCKIMENCSGARQDGARREHARQDDVRTDDAQEEFPESRGGKAVFRFRRFRTGDRQDAGDRQQKGLRPGNGRRGCRCRGMLLRPRNLPPGGGRSV